MDFKNFCSELEQLPHFLQHKKDEKFFFITPSENINNPNLTFFYNVITQRLFIVSEENVLIASSDGDIDINFTKDDSNNLQKIVDQEKIRAEKYKSPDISLLNKDVSEILSDFIVIDKVGKKDDPLTKMIRSKKGIGYMSLETNQLLVHDLKDDDFALATSLTLAVIMTKENLINILPYLKNELKNELNSTNNISNYRKNKIS